MFNELNLSPKPLDDKRSFGKSDNTEEINPVDDILHSTTFDKWYRKQAIDWEYKDDPNFNKEEMSKQYEYEIRRPLTIQEIDALDDAHSSDEFYAMLENIKENEQIAETVKNHPISAFTADLVLDPLNAAPVGGLLEKGKTITKLIKGGAIGAGYGATYNYMNNEIDNQTGGYLSSMTAGAVLGAGLEGVNVSLNKLFGSLGNPEKAVDSSIEAYKKKGYAVFVNEKQPFTSPLDNTFDIMTSSPNKAFNAYGLMFAPNLIKAEGNLINAKSAKELLFSKAVSVQDSFNKAVKLGMKEVDGWNIPAKEAYIHNVISESYFNRYVMENLQNQLKSTKNATEKELLEGQIEELQKKINDIESKHKFIQESGILNTVADTFKFYQREYEKVGTKLPKRNWYMTVRWDFDKIDQFAKAGKLQAVYDAFYKMVYYSKQYDEFLQSSAGKGIWKNGTEEGKYSAKFISKEEFADKVSKQIVDRLLASNQKRQFMSAVNVDMRVLNNKAEAGHEIPIKFRNLNHYYGKDFMNTDLYGNLHHYATKSSGVLAIRKSLAEFKKTNPEMYADLETTIERHPEKGWKLDKDLHTVIEQTLLDRGESVPRKYTKAMSDSIRQILGTNYTLNNKDDWMYKTIKFANTLGTAIVGGGFGWHSAGDIPTSVFVGNLVKGGHLNEVLSFFKDLKEVRKGIKDKERTGKLMQELAVFTETLGNMKIDGLTIDPSTTISPNVGDKMNSMYDRVISYMKLWNDFQFKVTGMRWVTGTAQASAAFKYIKDFEAIADGAKVNESVLKIMGITHEEAIEIGEALQKARSVVDNTEIPDLGMFVEITKQNIEKDIFNDVMKETEERFIKRSYNARVRSYVKKNDGHYPTSEIKEQLMKDAKEAFNYKRNKIEERVKASKKYQQRLEDAVSDDSRSLYAKFNYAVTNAMDLKFTGGATPRLPSLAATIDNTSDYIVQTLFLKFIKYPLAAYTTMMRYGWNKDKIGLAIGVLASTMAMMSIEALRDQASSLITGKDPKYDLSSKEGWLDLTKRGVNYSTALGGVTVPLETINNIFTEDPSRNITGMMAFNMLSDVSKSTINGIKKGEFTQSNLNSLLNITPFTYWPIMGDLIRKTTKDALKKGSIYESKY